MVIKQQKQNRRSFILLIIAFILPIAFAKLALTFNWLNYGVTNKGELIKQPLTVQDFDIDKTNFPHQWLLAYVIDRDCPIDCQQILAGVNNTYIAIGREIPRVTPLGLFQHQPTENQLAMIKKSDWVFLPATAKTLSTMSANKIYVIDPLGNVVLSHSLPTTVAAIPNFGKAIVADMKKLLKYSKVG